MAYRLCTLDADGKITSVSLESYADSINPDVRLSANRTSYHFINEDSLSSLLTSPVVGIDDQSTISIGQDGSVAIRIPDSPPSILAQYDPRTEVVLYTPDTPLQFTHGDRIVQDVTKVTTVYNSLDTTTIPYHSTTQKKFGLSSGKFTKNINGYTGSGLVVSNISKTNYTGGYTAPHNNLAANSTASYSMELFFRPESIATNFTLMQKGPTGASANWKLGYDSSAGFLQFAWQSYGYASGYNYSENIVNTAGLTLNTWHHVAVSVIRNVTSGTGYLISGYFNGKNVFTRSVTASSFPEMRYDNPIYIGCDHLGNEYFDGYIDSTRVLESGSTYGIFGKTGYGFLPHASGTLSVPTTQGFTRNPETAFILNFNGIEGSSAFYGESKDFFSGTVTRLANLTLGPTGPAYANKSEIGVRNVVRYTLGYTGATGFSDPTGYSLSYGHIVLPYVAAYGNTTSHGYDFIYNLSDVYDNDLSIGVFRQNYRIDAVYDASRSLVAMIEGAYGNIGSCGSVFQTQYGTNPFVRLFSNGGGMSYGIGLSHNSLYIDPLNQNTMRYIMDSGYLASQGITASTYSFIDGRGITRNINSTDMINLRLDLISYQNSLINQTDTTIASINSAATKNEVKFAKLNKSSGSIYSIISPKEEFNTYE
jgi:hypothetical protein